MPISFLRLVMHPFKYRIFLLTKLPAAFFSGVRVQYADEAKALVTVPYKWLTTNPFKSTYFACLSMAAEMSTGLLAMAHTYKQQPPISMLVVKTEGNYFKKATGITTFTCEDGIAIQHIIQEAMSSGKSTSITARSIGKDNSGEVVAEFSITWSFKIKANKNNSN